MSALKFYLFRVSVLYIFLFPSLLPLCHTWIHPLIALPLLPDMLTCVQSVLGSFSLSLVVTSLSGFSASLPRSSHCLVFCLFLCWSDLHVPFISAHCFLFLQFVFLSVLYLKHPHIASVVLFGVTVKLCKQFKNLNISANTNSSAIRLI